MNSCFTCVTCISYNLACRDLRKGNLRGPLPPKLPDTMRTLQVKPCCKGEKTLNRFHRFNLILHIFIDNHKCTNSKFRCSYHFQWSRVSSFLSWLCLSLSSRQTQRVFLSFLVVMSFIFSFMVVSVSFFEVDLGSNGWDVTSHSPSTVRIFLKLASNCVLQFCFC